MTPLEAVAQALRSQLGDLDAGGNPIDHKALAKLAIETLAKNVTPHMAQNAFLGRPIEPRQISAAIFSAAQESRR